MKKSYIHIVSIALVLMISLVAAARWLLDVEALSVFGHDVLHMPFTTAVCLFLLGVAYWIILAGKKYRVFHFIVLAMVFFIAIAGLCYNLFGTLTPESKRFLMSSAASVGLMTLVVSFLLIECEKRRFRAIGQHGFHLVTLVAFFIILGFIFSQASESRFSFLSSMNFWSAVTFISISASATFLNPELGFTGLLLGKGPGNQVTRNMFFMMVFTVVTLGSVILRLWRDEILSFESGILIFGLLVLVLTMAFLSIVARRLNTSHKLRLKADSQLRQTNANLEMKILERTSFLKETLEFLNETNRVANIGGWDVDIDSRKVSWTSITKMIHEVSPNYEPDIDTTIQFYKEGKSRESISKAINNAISMGISWDLELQIITEKGNEKWVRSIGKPTFRNGKCIKINGTFQDINTRRKAEILAQEESRSLQTIIDNVPVNIYAKDLDSRKTLINKQELRFMGLTDASQVLGKSDYDLFPKESADISRAEDLEVFQSKEPILAKETFLQHKDGRKFWFLTSKIPLMSEEGEITGLLGLSVDITQRKLDEDKLKKFAVMEANSKEMEQFADIASLDLREPLLAIKNYMEILVEDYKDQLDGKGQYYTSVIMAGVNRMEALIDGLLNYSRLSKTEELKMTDFREIVDEVVREKTSLITEAEAQVKVGPMPSLMAYPKQIKVLFEALLSNALKFRDSGVKPMIEIQSGESGDGWTFFVRDNGIGMAGKDLDRVFAIFKRLNDQRRYSGIGIGLANCQKIVENHSGRIWIESEEGGGSIVYFTIPVDK